MLSSTHNAAQISLDCRQRAFAQNAVSSSARLFWHGCNHAMMIVSQRALLRPHIVTSLIFCSTSQPLHASNKSGEWASIPGRLANLPRASEENLMRYRAFALNKSLSDLKKLPEAAPFQMIMRQNLH